MGENFGSLDQQGDLAPRSAAYIDDGATSQVRRLGVC
jgi:hypothetical protein